jgi:exopolyphosphatase/guanosine-5'-triphosphate,3'-diphosphate pyrophosphatase
VVVAEPPHVPWPGGQGAVPAPDGVMAAVDLGSNSFHMLVVRQVDGRFTVLDRLREMVRLAAGLDERGELTEASMARALECLSRFGQRLRDIRPARVRAVGTNTFRRAKTVDAFLERAQAALGFPIEIISGREEARLIYLGAAHTLPAGDVRRLVVDIGGGSTEIIAGTGLRARELASMYMGCVSVSEAFFPGGKISAKRFRRARTAAAVELEPVVPRLRAMGWEKAIGTSGTIRTTESVLRELGWVSERITLVAMERLAEEMVGAGHVNQLRLPGLSAQRTPVYPGGLAILMSVFEALGIEAMRVSDAALREGLLHDLAGRYTDEDARIRTVEALQDRFGVDREQASRVEAVVNRLLVQCREAWDLEDALLQYLLRWAGRLHEIGLAVAHAQYHKHGAYLLENGDLPGFSRHEQQLLARLVRAHRRKIPADLFDRLNVPWPARIQRAAVLLRVAVLLNRGRSDSRLPEFEAVAGKRSLTLRFPDGWLEAHPLTRADLDEEATLLAAGVGIDLTFE